MAILGLHRCGIHVERVLPLPPYIERLGQPWGVLMPKPGPRSDGDQRVVPHCVGRFRSNGEVWLLRLNPDGDAWMTVRHIEEVE